MQGTQTDVAIPTEVYNALLNAEKEGSLDDIKEMYDKEIGTARDIFIMHAVTQYAADMDIIDASGDVKAMPDGTVVSVDKKERDSNGRFIG